MRDDGDIIEGEFEERPDQDHQIGDKKVASSKPHTLADSAVRSA